jgi:oligopeptide/dipeptide ABC transporter ATP-binding protein
MNTPKALLEVQQLRKWYPLRSGFSMRSRGSVKAVDGVSLDIPRGEILGLVGESGCGKSTLGRLMLNLIPPSSGRVFFDGVDMATLSGDAMRQLRKRVQIVFQDPYSSLNPRMSVGAMLKEILLLHRFSSEASAGENVAALLETVGLDGTLGNRHPHEFSSGQRQRIGIARSLAVQPDFIVCDEPVSALDVSIQAQILNLLLDLRDRFSLTYLFISHDLHVVRHISDRIAVMYLGRIVEIGPAAAVAPQPLHPYTRALVRSAPVPGAWGVKSGPALTGDVPSPVDVPPGCPFHPRCSQALPECSELTPVLAPVNGLHSAACLLYDASRSASETAHTAGVSGSTA